MDAQRILAHLTTPVWLVDIDAERVLWTNRAAQALDPVQDLAKLRGGALSLVVQPVLRDYLPEFQLAETVVEIWTIANQGQVAAIGCRCSGLTLDDGRMVMLVEGHQKTAVRPASPTVWQGGFGDAGLDSQPGESEPQARIQLYEKLFRVNAAPMLLIDPQKEGRIVDANPAAVEFYGYDYDRLCSMHTWEINTLGKAVLPIMREVASWEGGHKPLIFRHRMADGSLRDVQTYAGPVELNGHRLMLAIIHDVTAREQAERELKQYREHLEAMVSQRTADLQKAKEAAEAANVAKSAFLANMSHEIRTPLHAISGLAYMITRGGLTPKQEEQMGKLKGASHHLAEVINDILDISKIESGKFELAERQFDLTDMVRRVTAMIQERCQAKGLALEVCIPAEQSLYLGDEPRLKQALLNYIGNAVKFTETGTITLRIAVADEAECETLLRFEVEDTGIGIPVNVQARLFSAFEQADNSSTRQYGGTGLGLVITRRIAELMGGEAGVTSIPGAGSTFWFTARLKKAETSIDASIELAQQDPESTVRECYSGLRVLLAEDEPVNREITQAILVSAGLQVDVAEDGKQAVRLFAENDYALVLMDVQMPVMDGLQATRQIRGMPKGRAVPILALTANAFDETRVRCLAAGLSDFIGKPVVPGAVFRMILRWLAPEIPTTKSKVLTLS